MEETDKKELLAKITNLVDYILTNISLLATVVLLIGYSILNQLDMLPSFFTPQTAALSYGTTITLFFVGLSHKMNDAIKQIESSNEDTKNAMTDIKNYEDNTKDELKNLNTILNGKCEDDAKVHVITSSEELYETLGNAILKAKSRVLIMHLDPHSPEYHNNPERTAYFNLIFDHMKNNPNNITMERITSLSKLEKAQWLWSVMEDTQDLEKLDIAYINIPNLEDMFLSTVVSCQIIDNDKIFILNPMDNTVPACGTCSECLYIESEKVVKVYIKYYDTLWAQAKYNVGGCRILKSGKDCDYIALKEIMDKLEKLQNNAGSCCSTL
jgi:hypothetical protein